MARKPQVRYYPSRGAYFTQVNGRQHKLADGPKDDPSGPTYLAALTAYRQVLEMGNVHQAKDRNTVRAVLETYLERREGRLGAGTFRRRLGLFRDFCAVHGETAVGALTPGLVEAFIDRMRKPRTIQGRDYAWGDATATIFVGALVTAFNWALKKERIITVNPLDGMERPAVRSRSRECVLTPAQHQRIVGACRATTLRNLIAALENTGARPGELVGATAADWRDDLGAIVYHRDDTRMAHEFKHKTSAQKDRTIYFTGDALAMVRELVGQNPTGRIFRTIRGKGYARLAINQCFHHLRQRLGMPKLIPYSYRHTFATRWLLAGKSIDILAQLLGNTPATIRRHYAHLCSDHQEIRRHLEAFKGVPAAGTENASAPPADAPRLYRA